MVVCLGYGKVEHIRSLDVRALIEHGHQLRQVIELGKSGLCPVSGALRSQLNGGHGFAEGRRPGIEVDEIVPFQCIILEVFLHGIHFYHRVADRGAGGEAYAPASGELIQIADLHIQVAGLLGLRLADAAHVTHFCERSQILVIMRLVDEELINAEFLKSHDIILPALIVQLVQLCLHLLFCPFHLLDGETVAPVFFQLGDPLHDLIHLLLQVVCLTLIGKRYLFELRVPDNDRIVVACGNTGAETFAVFGFKVLCHRHDDIGAGVELKILRSPLFREVIRHDDQALLAEPKAFGLLRDGNHRVGFPGTYDVSEKLIPAVKATGHGVELMLPQRDFRVDARQSKVASVVLSRTHAVELLIVKSRQPLPAFRILPDPLLKCLLDELLFSLGDGRLLLIQHRPLVSLAVLKVIEDTDVLEVQRLLHDLVAVDAVGAVGAVGANVGTVVGFPFDVPFTGEAGVVDVNVAAGPPWRVKELKHEPLIVV